jgi:hypothetical protein
MGSRIRHSLLTMVMAGLGLMAPMAAHSATTAPVILSLSYASANGSNQFIGSSLTLYMTVLQPTTQYTVTMTTYTAAVSGGSAGSVTLNSLSFQTGTPVYVTDGERTWLTNPSGSTVTLNNANLLNGATAPASWLVSDYSQIAFSAFRAYSGTLLTGATSPAPTVIALVAGFDQVTLNDSGVGGDSTTKDGVWSAAYVTSSTFNEIVSGAYFYGEVTWNGTAASNGSTQVPFQSLQTCNFDMVKPAILNYSFTTTNSNYGADLYLSSKCEGLPISVTQNVQPTSAKGLWNFTVNKANTQVSIVIDTASGGVVAKKKLTPYLFPGNSSSLQGQLIWQGDDGNGNFAMDGSYPVHLYIHDLNYVSGTPIVSSVKVISLTMKISNIQFAPGVVQYNSTAVNGFAQISYTVTVQNDSNNPALMNSSLGVLGWTTAAGVDSLTDLNSTVWIQNTVSYIDSTGAPTQIKWPAKDSLDDDLELANVFSSPFYYFEIPSGSRPAENYLTAVTGGEVQENGNVSWTAGCNAYAPAGSFVAQGDGDFTNDARMLGANSLVLASGTPTSPVTLSTGWIEDGTLAPVYIGWNGSTPPVGSYRLVCNAMLTGMEDVGGSQSTSPNLSGCDPTEGAIYFGMTNHFFAEVNPGIWIPNHLYGDRIYVTDDSFQFQVVGTSYPAQQGAPPQFLSSVPLAGSTIQPAAFGPSAMTFSAQFSENISASSAQFTVLDPLGVLVPGSMSTSGGSAGASTATTLYFTPSNSIVVGGTYTMKANACNSAGQCTDESLTFTVEDEGTPVVAGGLIQVLSPAGTVYANTISMFQTGAPTFSDVGGISVPLEMQNSSNSIYLAGCSATLYQVSGTSQIEVPMSLKSSSNNTLVYTLTTPINYAGLFEIVIQTKSKDASGNIWTSTLTQEPEFQTAVCTACAMINWNSTGPVAIDSIAPVTVTAGGVQVSTANLAAASMTFTVQNDAGYYHLPTFASTSQLMFIANGAAQTAPMVWTSSGAVSFLLYFTPADLSNSAAVAVDLGATPTAASLVVRGLTASGAWETVSSTLNSASSPESLQVAPPYGGSQAADTYYGIAFAIPVATLTPTVNPSGTVTNAATPISFNNTRAFNPNNANAAYRKATFYYSSVPATSAEARVFDTAGHLIRDLTLGNGIDPSQASTDPIYGTTQYYFTWDGTNDSGGQVRNGLYLVRWTVTGSDGSHNSQTKPVALIK